MASLEYNSESALKYAYNNLIFWPVCRGKQYMRNKSDKLL
jgi:hypothetical protein